MDTFVITEYNMAQTALYNQKMSSFHISSATCYPHILFHHHLPPLYNQKLSSFNISSATSYPHIMFFDPVVPSPPQAIHKLYLTRPQLQILYKSLPLLSSEAVRMIFCKRT